MEYTCMINCLFELMNIFVGPTSKSNSANIQAELLLENQPPPPPPPPPQSLTTIRDEGDTSNHTTKSSSINSVSNAKTKDTNGMENKLVAWHSLELDPVKQTVTGTNDTSSKEIIIGALSDVTGPSSKVAEDTQNRNGTESFQLADPSNSKNTEGAKDIREKEDDQFGLVSDSRSGQMQTTDQPQHNDEPSEPEDVPDSVEIKLPGADLRDKEEPNKYDSGINALLDSSEISFRDKSKDENPEDDTDRGYGNPPVLSNSDLLDLAKKIPDDLSEEEREKLRQSISDSLGLSALGPGVAMLPLGQKSQTHTPTVQEKSATSTLDLFSSSYSYSTSTSTSTSMSTSTSSSTSTSTQSSEFAQGMFPDMDGNAILNRGKADLADKSNEHLKDDDSNNDYGKDKDFRNDEVVSGKQDESFGRKVLNENDDGDYSMTDDDYEDDDFMYEEDEEDDDYTGGEVFIFSSTTTTTRIPPGAGDQSKDTARGFEQSQNKLAGFGKLWSGILPGPPAWMGWNCK